MSDQVTAAVNRHMTHLEDAIFYGKLGADLTIKMLSSLLNKLSGQTSDIKASIKLDGAPAMFVASSFRDVGGPFISTKGLFAKDAKLCFSNEDIQKYYGDKPGLAEKLAIALSYIDKLDIPKDEVWQGDQLFTKSSLTRKTLSGIDYYVFKPNTVIYAVEVDSEMGQKIERADIGIAWHTRYTGKDLPSLRASYDVSTKELNDIPEVLSMDVYLDTISEKSLLSEEEKNQLAAYTSKAKAISDGMDSNTLQWLADNEPVKILLMTYSNALIREGLTFYDFQFKDYMAKLTEWLNKKYQVELAARKTDKGKLPVQQFYGTLFKLLAPNTPFYKFLEDLFNFQTVVVAAKKLIISKFESEAAMQAFFDSGTSYTKTGQEGYAVSDIQGNVVKLVDRDEFSRMNFNAGSFKKPPKEVKESYYIDLTSYLETVPLTMENIESRIKEYSYGK